MTEIHALTCPVVASCAGLRVVIAMSWRLPPFVPGPLEVFFSPSSGAFDYGYLSATATMPAGKGQVFYDAADKIVAALKAGKIDADTFERARAPTLQDLRHSTQTNDYWLALLNNGWDLEAKFKRARRYEKALQSVTAADVAAAARKYLTGTKMAKISAGS